MRCWDEGGQHVNHLCAVIHTYNMYIHKNLTGQMWYPVGGVSDILPTPESLFPPNSSICPSLSLGQRWRGILIYIVMHQHFGCPGSIEVWQHLGQPVRVNSLADTTCPAPLIELLAICRPRLSCCHIIVNLGVAAVHHVLIGWDNGIQEHLEVIIAFSVS